MINELKKSILFSQLTPDQQQRVVQNAHMISLNQGESLFEQGDTADRFYLLLKGHVKLYRLSPAGDEKVIEVVTAISTFAEALMFLKQTIYPVGAQALSPIELISIDAHDFTAMLHESVETCFVLLGVMSQRLRGLIREIDDISLHSATARLAGYLLSQKLKNTDEFTLKAPKQIIASRLSIKPETFSRILKNLSQNNYIDIKGNHVRIKNQLGLTTLADVCALPDDGLLKSFDTPPDED